MRASLASATSLFALLLVSSREALGTTLLTYGDVLVGQSASGTDTATITGESGTTIKAAAPGTPFGGAAISQSITASSQNVSGTYTFTPLTTGAASTTVLLLDKGTTAATFTLSGTGVAPLESVASTSPDILVGQSGTVSLTVSNIGNGNLSGAGTISNLRGTVSAGNSVFVGTATSFSLADPTQTAAATSSSFGFTFSPTVVGAASTTVTTAFANGMNASNAGGTVVTTLSATGVAPIESVTSGSISSLARVGSTVSSTITVANIGNGNLAGTGTLYNLNGSVTNVLGAGFASANTGTISLASNAAGTVASTATTTLGYTYAPVSRGTSSSTVSIAFSDGNSSGSNLSQSVVRTLTGTAVGPVYTSSIRGASVTDTPTAVAHSVVGAASSTIAFGAINTNVSRTVYLDLENTSPDPGGSLTNLTIESYSISGGAFSVSLAANSIISESGNLLVPITVIGTAGYQALSSTLTIFTDESVALGGAGDTFTYALTANSIPEPTSLLALGAGLAGLASVRRRRAAPSA